MVAGSQGAFFYKNSDFEPRHFSDTSMQNVCEELGLEGWELVAVAPLTETVHPNFGDEKYVTGLQPNVRTASFWLIFKRPITIKREMEMKAKADSIAAAAKDTATVKTTKSK